MAISFKCGHCNKSIKASNSSAGRTDLCPSCGEDIQVPGGKSVTAPASFLGRYRQGVVTATICLALGLLTYLLLWKPQAKSWQASNDQATANARKVEEEKDKLKSQQKEDGQLRKEMSRERKLLQERIDRLLDERDQRVETNQNLLTGMRQELMGKISDLQRQITSDELDRQKKAREEDRRIAEISRRDKVAASREDLRIKQERVTVMAGRAANEKTSKRISDLEKSIAIAEKEGTELTQRRGKVMAEGAGASQEAYQMKGRYTNLQQQLRNRRYQLQIATDNQTVDKIILREQQIGRIEFEMSSLQTRWQKLEGRYHALNREARDLLGQIQYKSRHRDKLVLELSRIDPNIIPVAVKF